MEYEPKGKEMNKDMEEKSNNNKKRRRDELRLQLRRIESFFLLS